MLVIGVTGGFGTGKSTVANFFASLGAQLIDADRIARNLIRKNSPLYEKVISAFGKDILSKDKSINRKKLSRKVFSNKENVIPVNYHSWFLAIFLKIAQKRLIII